MGAVSSVPPRHGDRCLEIAVDDLGGALAAAAAGADRLEVCASLACGGLTPSSGLVAALRAAIHLPLVVLIRPRAGDFVYGAHEHDVMCRDVEAFARQQVDGFALGVLTRAGGVDVARMESLRHAAAGVPVACHRAYDDARDPWEALDALIDVGCARVLTAGGAATALGGIEGLRARQVRANGRLTIVAAGGVRADGVAALFAAGLREFHAGPRRAVAARPGLAYSGHPTTDADAVGALARALQLAQ
ncbi:MAG: copper homeostasis protein CutC [Planctomycetota bacterium]